MPQYKGCFYLSVCHQARYGKCGKKENNFKTSCTADYIFPKNIPLPLKQCS